MISKTLCDSVGGGGIVAECFVLSKSIHESVGGGGGSSAEFFFSVTYKQNFPLMGPF